MVSMVRKMRAGSVGVVVFGLALSCASQGAPEIEPGVYRVLMALRQNSGSCPGTGDVVRPFAPSPRFLKVSDEQADKKAVGLCALDTTACEPLGTLSSNASYDPPAWMGASTIATRIDENTCAHEIIYSSAVTLSVSNFESTSRIRFRRAHYTATYTKPTPAPCLPDEYQGKIECQFEELFEAAP